VDIASKVQSEILFFVLKNEVMHVFRAGLSKEFPVKQCHKDFNSSQRPHIRVFITALGREQRTTRQAGWLALFLVRKTFCQTYSSHF